ncbi:MAG TPA: potassium transporter TrkG [bacterium]|nr:potassium transporter TrkG [bacterium]HPS30369.1 potassium transporter TrkG [bacterium]
MKTKRLSSGHYLMLSFIVLILTGTLFLKIPVSTYSGISWINALFTATSAVCVTGLTSVDTASTFTITGQIIILLLIQFGGIGIMTFAAMFIFSFNKKLSVSNRVMMEDSFIQGASDFKLSDFVRFIVKYTLIFEGAGAILFFVLLDEKNLFKRLYFSIFHSISAFCNAGFSTYSDNLVRYSQNAAVNITTMVLIVSGGIGFFVMFEIKTKVKSFFVKESASQQNYYFFSLHTWIVLVTTVILITGGAFLIYSFETHSGGNISFLQAFFQSVTSRTAGFNTIDISSLNHGTLLIIMVLMFIGGSPGSTAGGIKTSTFAIIFSIIFMGRNNFKDVVIRNRHIPRKNVIHALVVFVFAFNIVMVSTVLIIFFHPEKDIMSVLFESVSAFGTVGLSTGITSSLNGSAKLVIIATMFCGRIGTLTIFSLFLLRKDNPVKYAEERIMVG